MTKPNCATQEEVENWFVLWMGRLGLNGWTVRFDYPSRGTGSDMKLSWTQCRCVAVLTVYPAVFKQVSRAKAWRDTCHEGLHLAFALMDDEIVEYVGGGRVFQRYRDAQEVCIDRLAGCLTGMMSVPE
jgi:hypothetical protein